MHKLLIALASLVAALALAPASLAAPCADCDPGGGGGGGGNAAPTAAFSSTPSNPATGDLVTFTNSSTDSDGSITSTSWSFGDGITSTLSSPQHPYASSGTYTVTLTVTDNDGAQSSVSHDVTVSNRAPVSAFDVKDVVAAGEDIALVNHGYDPDGSVASYAWDFGDGTTSTADTPPKAYATPGTYTVTLKVTDDENAVATSSQQVRVNAPPTAQILVAPSQTASVAVAFDSSAQDGDGSVQSYAWDFGDGTQASGPTPSHTYAQAGSYKVRLTVTDSDGATGQAKVTVDVAAPPTSGGGNTGGGDNTGGGGSNTGGGSTPGAGTGSGGQGGSADQGGAGTGADRTPPSLIVPATIKAKKKAGKLVYTVRTDEAATIVAKLKGKVAGGATLRIAKAGSGKVAIKLSSKARKALRAAKSIKLTLVTTATDAAGNKTTKTTRVVLV